MAFNKKNIKIVDKKDDGKISQVEVDKLIGIAQTDGKYYTINKNEWKNCLYCEKFHHRDYYIVGLEYCIHCWGWLNAHEYDVETGVYSGIINIEDIKKAIKKSYPVHLESDCKNADCIFNKIKKCSDSKILHTSLNELLELNKKPIQSAVCFNYKNKNLNVNFEDSYIVI